MEFRLIYQYFILLFLEIQKKKGPKFIKNNLAIAMYLSVREILFR